ncbi:MFS transporter [Tessaracoccus antarcticus]|uniref:MFS transporter n=1 Tax=Tessaracoccus antarcticus TaxID=2479848 RepID=A0A3M0G249_9ACTN|nr:MFS transporter [Tessaracoccus antarcticus]RMB58197.1 MFS transporter [Tessaracoccus antarcticus]
MSRTFASLRIYNYRCFAAGALASNIGTWMARTAQDWLVLTELTDRSSIALGIVTGLQFLPIPLLAPYAGLIADRMSKVRLLKITQAALSLNALALFILVGTGTAQLWHVYLLAFIQGIAVSFDNPARQAFVNELVPHELVPNAVGLNSASFNSARLFGPALAGIVIGLWGVAPALAINAASFGAVLLSLFLIREAELLLSPPRTTRGTVAEGIAYVRARPDLVLIFAVIFMLGTFGMNFQITMALMATKVYGKGAAEFGLLGSFMAIGTLAGALMAARRGTPRLRTLLGALGAFSVACFLAGLAPSYSIFALLLIPCGLFALTVMTTANSTVQLSTQPEFRGRVMALYMAIFMGGTPLGAPIIGWVGDAFGPRWTLLVGAIACWITFLAVGWFLIFRRNLRARLRLRWPLRLEVWHKQD